MQPASEFSRLRASAGFSIDEVAEAAGFSRRTVYRWEQGVTPPRRAAMRLLDTMAREHHPAVTGAGGEIRPCMLENTHQFGFCLRFRNLRLQVLSVISVIVMCCSPAAAAARDLTLDQNGSGTIQALINGRPATLRVDLDAPRVVTLNPAAAERLGLHGGMFSSQAVVGPIRLKGSVLRKEVTFGEKTVVSWIVWFEREYAPGVDGVISPALLPDDDIKLIFRAPRLTDRESYVPVDVTRTGGITYAFHSARDLIQTSFSTRLPRSSANAVGGSILLTGFQGRLIGDPQTSIIAFGIGRPVRTAQLNRPYSVGPFKVSEFDVRIEGLAQGANNTPLDPDEIIVTADRKQKPKSGNAVIGHEELSKCASVTFIKATSRLVLLCP